METTALRELLEESGIRRDQIKLLPGERLVEMSARGNPATEYLVAVCTCEEKPALVHSDPAKLASVQWFKIPDALVLLRASRQAVLRAAHDRAISFRDI